MSASTSDVEDELSNFSWGPGLEGESLDNSSAS